MRRALLEGPVSVLTPQGALTGKAKIELKSDLTGRQRDALKAGGVLNMVKEEG